MHVPRADHVCYSSAITGAHVPPLHPPPPPYRKLCTVPALSSSRESWPSLIKSCCRSVKVISCEDALNARHECQSFITQWLKLGGTNPIHVRYTRFAFCAILLNIFFIPINYHHASKSVSCLRKTRSLTVTVQIVNVLIEINCLDLMSVFTVSDKYFNFCCRFKLS